MVVIPNAALIKLQKYNDDRDFLFAISQINSAVEEGSGNFEVDVYNLESQAQRDLLFALENLGYTVDFYPDSGYLQVSID